METVCEERYEYEGGISPRMVGLKPNIIFFAYDLHELKLVVMLQVFKDCLYLDADLMLAKVYRFRLTVVS